MHKIMDKNFNLATVIHPFSRQGIVVINESPAVNLENFDETLLENHKKVMGDLIRRDKRHPSVVMWSLANEPR